MNSATAKRLLLILLSAFAVVCGVDLAIQRVSPVPPRIIEVSDGVAAYEDGDPQVLVLGSSHTRSFVPVRDMLQRESNQRMTLVPVEWGTFSSYRWVLMNRLAPLIEERRPDGTLRRPSLKRALLIATFYDLCEKSYVGQTANLPARAWTARHFLADVAENGLTPYNRNYLSTQWKLLFGGSILVTDRGYQRAPYALIGLLHPLPPAPVLRARRIEHARHHMEEQCDHCDDPDEKQELRQMIEYLQGRGVEVVIVNFPLDPAIITETARKTTLARYAAFSASLDQQLKLHAPVRVVDLTEKTPLQDADFQPDLDHVTTQSNVKFAAWALQHDLSFLRTLPEAPR